jgi:predicted transcriptional regulator
MNDYSQTVDGLSALKAIADDLNRAIVVIHHNRKGANHDGDHMESALGSTGINATADCTLTITRRREASEAVLKATGRDIRDTSFTLSWDDDICSWSIAGQGTLKPTLTEAQQQIVDLLESEDRIFTTTEISERLGKDKGWVSRTLKQLAGEGLIAISGTEKRRKWAAKNVDLLSSPIGEVNKSTTEKASSGATVIPFPEAQPAELESR